jgi:hypothetical protein
VVDYNTYPGRDFTRRTGTATESPSEDPSEITNAVFAMIPRWDPINICLGGTRLLREQSERLIPREPREDEEAYKRRIFHATLPPFLQRLASQAAGLILRKGIQLDGDPYWTEWSRNVSGDGTTLNAFARRMLEVAILYGHSSALVDFPAGETPRTLAEERAQRDRQPYLIQVNPTQILGWRTNDQRPQSELEQVRIREFVALPLGSFGEEIEEQIRVLEPGRYKVYRRNEAAAGNWEIISSGETSLDSIPLVTVYSNRLGNLLSTPPLLEVAYLNISYAQRFCDYMHAIHTGAMPILTMRGFDPDGDVPIGISVNTAVLLPPDGGCEYVQPTSEAFESQLKCLEALEDQISRLGINTLSQQNVTNAAAESKRLDRIDSDSIMALISGDLKRALEEMLRIAGTYAGIEPPQVIIEQDYENRLIDGNQITAYLQLYMQNAISQETLLRILQTGEVLPPELDIPTEMDRTEARAETDLAMERLSGPDLAFQSSAGASDTTAPRNPGQGESLTSQTLPTPLRSGRDE